MNRVLVTGGSGFLGAWIVKRLAGRGIQARVFDVSGERRLVAGIAGPAADSAEWVSGDVCDADGMTRAAAGCDGIIHLAGMLTPACQTDPVRGAQVNLIGTLNAFEAARANGLGSVVYASSAGVFGPRDPVNPAPDTHYGAFKLACEGSGRAYFADAGLASVGFRPYIVYGPGREVGASAGVTLACRAAARGEPFVVPFTGACGFVYADDVAAAFETALLSRPAGARVYNIVGEVATVEQVLGHIHTEVPGAQLRAEGGALPITEHLDEKALDEWLPDRQRTRLADGIRATVEHYRR